MGLPASVRVNAQFPFPSLVTGANGIVADALNNIGLTVSGNVSASHIGVVSKSTLGDMYVTDRVAKSYTTMKL